LTWTSGIGFWLVLAAGVAAAIGGILALLTIVTSPPAALASSPLTPSPLTPSPVTPSPLTPSPRPRESERVEPD
jgi:hypothetical protein